MGSENMNYYNIGQRIRKIRKAYGMSQEVLAERAGISTTHMSHIETGNTKLSLPVFLAIATVLEVHTDELLCDNKTFRRSHAAESIGEMLETCTTQQVQIIEDIARAAILSLKKHQ